MLTQNSIKPQAGSKTTFKRLGRWNWSWKWTFSWKGCKWQNARKGSKFSPSFEWGQSPLFIRMPKMRGFTALNQIKYIAVNISTLDKIASEWITQITKEVLIKKWIIKKTTDFVKILANWETKNIFTVEANKASKEALSKIEKAWWKIELK